MDRFLDDKSKQSIKHAVGGYRQRRLKTMEDLGRSLDQYRDQLTGLRQKVFDDFENNLEIAKENLSKHGFAVHEAKDADEVKGVLEDVLAGAQKIVKSKSNLGKEIGIRQALDELGRECHETDLGDFVVELAGVEDQHYVLPAINLGGELIARKAKEKFGDQVGEDPKELTHYLCSKIRERILGADAGITGANFFTKSGEVVLLENEGNISLVSRLPKKHIIICAIDKLTETAEDAILLSKAAAIFGTGQDITKYISIIAGPSATADIENTLVIGAQGTHEAHVILVDNGRRKMMEQGLQDLLRCINCGACVNFCPVYHQLGIKYGGQFAGSKGVIMASEIGEGSLEKAKAAGSFLCTLCGSCSVNCPMKITLRKHVREIRSKQDQQGLQSEPNERMLGKIKTHGNPFGEKKDKELPDDLYCC